MHYIVKNPKSKPEKVVKELSDEYYLGTVINEVHTVAAKMDNLEEDIMEANEGHRQLHRAMDHHMEFMKTI